MITDRDLDERLRAFHDDPARHADLEAAARRILATPIETSPTRRTWPRVLPTERLGNPSSAATFVFGVVAVLVISLLSIGILGPRLEGDPLPAAVASATPATPVPSEAPTPPPPPRTRADVDIVVARDGSGDHETIGAAINAARVGDSVGITPGRYEEAITIVKRISVVGLGPREVIVIVRTGQQDEPATLPVVRVGDGATLAGVTILDERAIGRFGPPPSEVHLEGPADAVLEDVAVDVIRIRTGSQAIVRDNDVATIIVEAAASPRIEGNRAGSIEVGDPRDDLDGPGVVSEAAVIDNDVSDRLSIGGFGTLVEGNRVASFSDGGQGSLIIGNELGSVELRGVGTILRDNVVRGGEYGVLIGDAATDITVEANALSGRLFGLGAAGSGHATIRDNRIGDSGIGLVVISTGADIADNVICDNDEDVVRTWEARLDPDANEICSGDVRVAGSLDDIDEGAPGADADGFVWEELEPGIRRLVHDGAGHRPRTRWVFEERDIGYITTDADGSIRVRVGVIEPPVADLVDLDHVWTLGEPGEAIAIGDPGAGDGPLWAAGTRALDPAGQGARRIIHRVAARADGVLWAIVATHEGRRPARFDGEAWTVFPAPPPSRGFQLEDGVVGPHGNVWVWRDRGGGLGVFDGRSVRTIAVGRTLTPRAFDQRGRLWTAEVLEHEDDPRGIVVIDADLVDATSLERPIADPDLAARFPARLAGSELDVVTLSGEEWRRQFQPGPGRTSPRRPGFEGVLQVAGASIDDLSVGYTSVEPTPHNRAYLAAVRVRGTDAADLLETVVAMMFGHVTEPSYKGVDIAGKRVQQVTDAAAPGSYPQYAYAADDTVWVIDAEEPVLSEIVAALP